jgi:uncharacterized integral membrane protein (TIGR00697 family)
MNTSPRFTIIAVVFVTCLITANTIAVKVVNIWSFELPAAIFVFPLSYIFGDILTEVYGYQQARKIIWLGFACNLVFVFFVWVGQILPAADFWKGNQAAYESILGQTPRILAASFLGYLVGEFVNSFVLARMKIMTRGRWLWSRTIGSTVVGQGLDTVIFIVIAFAGPGFNPMMILNHWLAKVIIEAAATPLTYRAVNYLKKKESTDTYDYDTNFNPFLLRDRARKTIG